QLIVQSVVFAPDLQDIGFAAQRAGLVVDRIIVVAKLGNRSFAIATGLQVCGPVADAALKDPADIGTECVTVVIRILIVEGEIVFAELGNGRQRPGNAHVVLGIEGLVPLADLQRDNIAAGGLGLGVDGNILRATLDHAGIGTGRGGLAVGAGIARTELQDARIIALAAKLG